jgi:hypothetical protein
MTHVGKDIEKKKPLHTVGGNVNYRENRMEVSQNIKNRTAR